MPTIRRFIVLQCLLLWQGGFFFYAAVVVPIGTDVLGPFAQGSVTRHVTQMLNWIGFAAILVLAWDQFSNKHGSKRRWWLWAAMSIALLALVVLHPIVESRVDFGTTTGFRDYPSFYLWHRVYLYVSAVQWLAGLAYMVFLIRDWRAADRLERTN